MRILLITTVCLLLCGGAALAEAERDEGGVRAFAVVGGTAIPVEEFEANFHAGVRQRFYHGQVPADELAAFRREVAEAMIDRVLLLQEAERRGIEPDAEWVEARLGMFAERLAAASDPERARADARAQLLGDSVIVQLRERIEDIPAPGREEALAYYRANPDKFTTPERIRVSLILLGVEPWSGAEAWEAAHDLAQELRERLAAGESFAELARRHSTDDSAARGGDLGYVHEGMLAREAQTVLDGLSPGDVAGPVQLLQGFALLRLEERTAPVLNDFDRVETRVYELLGREMRHRAWQDALAQLRARTPTTVDQAVLGGGMEEE